MERAFSKGAARRSAAGKGRRRIRPGLLPHLEALYSRYNRREFVAPDPLQFLFAYPDPFDREIVGMIGSALAFGNVKQILHSVDQVLAHMAPPRHFLDAATRRSLERTFHGFRHRYITGRELSALLWGMKQAIERHGSLGACYASGLQPDHPTVLPALQDYVQLLRAEGGLSKNYLLAEPAKGSACKRHHLFLRWMVRKDAVDPGGWEAIPPAKLIIPVDTHMHRIGLALGLTRRKQANLAAALEITAAFRKFAPEDPVRYDFSLTRLGIRKDTDLVGFLTACRRPCKYVA